MQEDLLQIRLLGRARTCCFATATLDSEVRSQFDFELWIELGHRANQVGHYYKRLMTAFRRLKEFHQVAEYVYISKLLPLCEH